MRRAGDRRIARYLADLDRALVGLPGDERRQIVDDIAHHIAEGRAGLDHEDPVAIEALLARIGNPLDIAADAGAPSRGPGPTRRLDEYVPWLLLLGGFIAIVGWLVGVALLWRSPAWRRADKLLGTLVLPGGLACAFALLGLPATATTCTGSGRPGAPIALHCTTSGFALPFPIGLLVLAAAAVSPLVTFVHLRRARDRRDWRATAASGW